MGCWNKTCAISQLPIQYGSATVRFVIIRGKQISGTRTDVMPSYSNYLWDIIPVPIYGRYNDYGGQEDNPGQEYKYDFLTRMYGRELTSDDPNYKLVNPFVNDESLNDAIHEGKTLVKGRHIASIMIHKHIADAIINLGEKQYQDKKFVYVEDLVNFLEAYKPFAKAEGEKIEQRFGGTNLEDDWLFDHRVFIARFLDSPEGKPFRFMRQSAELLGWFISAEGHFTWEKAIYKRAFSNLTPHDIAVTSKIERAFQELRKPIVPQVGEGSQGCIDKMHQAVHNAAGDIIKSYLRECRAERNG